VTAVTGWVRTEVTVEQGKPPPPLPSVGEPAEPRHSRTVTVDVPPAVVIELTMVTSQIKPLPPRSPRALPHVVVAAMVVPANAGEMVISETGTRSARTSRPRNR
jgi:hypothetical protein